ncbi:hypothetical protein AKO1_005390 [Acrasis kona]|uniref:Uncharacterized protein n=1 Tax=Acrasis kona TaxID=1008807 RepID=A0AAW2YL11_9EUKA
MPVVWTRRCKRWHGAWDIFKKHFVFYRLWIGIKKKKESAQIIRSFLNDTNMSLQLVRQVHLFRKRVIDVQRMVLSWWSSRKARLQVSLLQYSIVEAKMVMNISLKGDVLTNDTNGSSKSKDKDGKRRKRSGNKVSRGGVGSPSLKKVGTPGEDDKRKGVTFASEDAVEEKPMRATHQIKLQLIDREIKSRKEEYATAQSTYRSAIKHYEQRVQTLHWHQNARNIMSGAGGGAKGSLLSVGTPVGDVQVTDDKGNLISKPVQPILKIILSELEMKLIVLEGFEKLRQLNMSPEVNNEQVSESIKSILEYCGETVKHRWSDLLKLNPDAVNYKTRRSPSSQNLQRSNSSLSILSDHKEELIIDKSTKKKKNRLLTPVNKK